MFTLPDLGRPQSRAYLGKEYSGDTCSEDTCTEDTADNRRILLTHRGFYNIQKARQVVTLRTERILPTETTFEKGKERDKQHYDEVS